MKKAFLSLALLVLGGLIVLLIVFFVASRDIPPPDTTDLTPEHIEVPPEQNAYTYFLAATKSLDWPRDFRKDGDYLAGKPTDTAVIEEVIRHNRETLENIRKGLGCQRCVSPELTGPGSSDTVAWVKLGKVMAMSIRRDRLAQDYSEATRTCIALLHFGDTSQQDAERLVAYLVGLEALERGLSQARDLAGDQYTPQRELANLAEAIDKLGPLDRGLIHAMKADYRDTARRIDQIRDGTYDDGMDLADLAKAKPLLRFLIQRNKTKLMVATLDREIIKDAPLPYASINHPEADAARGEGESLVKRMLRPNIVGKTIAKCSLSIGDVLLQRMYQIQCSVAATRLVFACKAYQRVEGKLPDDLSALVPKYLDAIPADPYDGKPFRYVSAKGIVYSVGKDLVDSGGSTKLPAGMRPTTPAGILAHAADAVFELGTP